MALAGCSDSGSAAQADAGGADAAADGASQADAAVEIVCGEGTAGKLGAGGRVEVAGQQAAHLAGAAVAAPSDFAGLDVKIDCAPDIVPSTHRSLGPAVSFSPGATLSRDLRYTLPLLPARMPAGARPGSIVVWVKRGDRVENLPLLNALVELEAGRVSFDYDQLATFQAAVAADAGRTVKRRFAFRAVAGFSMGGSGAAVAALRHPDLFDIVGSMGGEPGPDFAYFLAMLERGLLAGFCTAADEAAGKGKIGELCSRERDPLPRQHELLATYEALIYQKGQGVGLTLDRDTYTRGLRDMIRAYGNPFYNTPDHPILPVGVPVDTLSKGSALCDAPVVLDKFYDRRFNPKGTYPVITFCDGSDSGAKGLGIFDPTIVQTTPMQVVLAVDVNANGKRDVGEPVVFRMREPFDDVGADGKPDADEAGYDAQNNPDPAGDNYHYLHNPNGTEGNWRRDEGEPFEDVGLDGVAGTCQHGSGPECYDEGEGNKTFDRAAMADRWLAHDPTRLYAALSAEQRASLDVWVDGGIRDFLNAHVAGNQFAGRLATGGDPVRIYDSFKWLTGDAGVQLYDFNAVDWANVGRHVYVRYGDPTLSAAQVEQTGDGRHVGTALQIANRTTSFFAYAQQRWPGGDRDLEHAAVTGTHFKKNESFVSPSTKQTRPYAVFLPPGYFEDANKERRYPVVYFFHGYGQQPEDLMALSGIFANYMVSENVAEAQRFQKFLIVYVDGRCRPGGELPLSLTGDRCEQGTFYVDAPDQQSSAQMETLLLELIDEIDKKYRTRAPEELQVPVY